MRLVADANVLLSAVLGGRAGLVLKHKAVQEILTTAFTMSEVQEYAAELARAKRLALDVVLLATTALPVTVVERDVYAVFCLKQSGGSGSEIRMTPRSSH